MKKKHWLIRSLAIAVAFFAVMTAEAQRVALKTNALYWATLTPNLSAEFRMSRHFSLNLDASFNPGLESVTKTFLKDNTTTELATFSPEVRYWFSARPQAGHFVGAMALGSIYKIGYKGNIHEGDALGAGLTYGYSFVIHRRWSIEATAGLGIVHLRERKYPTGWEKPADFTDKRTTFAPLKLGLSVVYILK